MRLGFESLEDRCLLRAVAEVGDFGDSFNPFVLEGDHTFEITGSIRQNDVDFFEVNAAAGGYLEVRAKADDLTVEAEPSLTLKSTAEGYRWYTVFGFPNYSAIERDVDEPDPQIGPGTIAAHAQVEIENGAIEATIEATTLEAASSVPGSKRWEWSVTGNISGNLVPYNEGSRFLRLVAANVADISVDWSSNYSGTIDTDLNSAEFGNSAMGYFDSSFPESADADMDSSLSETAHWEFLPDLFAPHIAVFDLEGNELIRGTSGIDLLIEESGTYLVGVAREDEFATPSGETRSFRRPYTLQVDVPVDLRVDSVEANTEGRAVDVKYSFDGTTEEMPLVSAYWATGDSEADVIRSAVVDQWVAERGDASHDIPLTLLSQPPASATHLAILADSEEEVLEIDEVVGAIGAPNNFGQIAIVVAPVVTVITGDGTGGDAPHDGDAMMKSFYSTWVQIENRSLIPHHFEAQLVKDQYLGAQFESIGNGIQNGFYFQPDNDASKQLPDWRHERSFQFPVQINVEPLTKSEPVWISGATTKWDWLPQPHEAVIPSEIAVALGLSPTASPEEVLTSVKLTFTKIISGLKNANYDMVFKGPGSAAAEAVKDLLKELKKASGLLADMKAIYEALEQPISQYPYVQFELTTRVDRVDGDQVVTVFQDPAPVAVRVGLDLQFYLIDARADLATAAMLVRRGWGQMALNPIEGLLLLELGIVRSESARKSYQLADDPPDPQYTEIVTPNDPNPAMTADQANVAVQQLAASYAEVERYADASYRARNKADGAAIEDDLFWQAEQLSDAALFDIETVLHDADVVGLHAVLADYNDQHAPSSADAVAALRNGLSEDTLVQLESLGLSRSSIEEFLAAVDEDFLTPPLSAANAARLELLTASNRALETLKLAVERRIASGGKVVPLSEQQRSVLDGLRLAVVEGTSIGASPLEMKQVATQYIRSVAELAIDTNNLESLQDDLEFALLSFSNAVLQFDPSESTFAKLIDEVELAGASTSVVEALRDHNARISQLAVAGDFTEVVGAVEGALTDVVAHWGGEIPNELAYQLFGQLATLRYYAGAGAPQEQLPTTDSQRFVSVPFATVVFDPIAAPFGESTALTYRAVSGSGGAVSISGEGASRKIEFTSGADPKIGAVASYALINTETWQFQTAHVIGEVLTPLSLDGSANSAHLDEGEAWQLGVELQRGDSLFLKSVVLPQELRPTHVSLIEPASGNVVADQYMWDAAVLTAPTSGTLVLQIESGFDDAIDVSFTAQRGSSLATPFTLGLEYGVTLLPGEQVSYTLQRDEQDVLMFDALSFPDFDGNDMYWTIVSPSQMLAAGNTDWGDSPLVETSEAGEYLVLLMNTGAEQEDVAFRVLAGADGGTLALDEPATIELAPRGAEIYYVDEDVARYLWLETQSSELYSGYWSIRQGEFETSNVLGESGLFVRDPTIPAYLVLSSDTDLANTVQIELSDVQPTELAFNSEDVVTVDLPLDAVAEIPFQAEKGELLLFDEIAGYLQGGPFVYQPDGVVSPLYTEEPFVASASGTYRAIVGGGGAPVELRLVRLSEADRLTPDMGVVQGLFEIGDAVQVFQFRPDESLEVAVAVQLSSGSFGGWRIFSADAEAVAYGNADESGQTSVVRLPSAGPYYLVVTNWSGDGVPFELNISGLSPPVDPAVVEQVLVNGGAAQRSNVDRLDIFVDEEADLQDLVDSGQIADYVELRAASQNQDPVELPSDRFAWDAALSRLTIDLTIDGFGGSLQSLLQNDRYELSLLEKVFEDADGIVDGRQRVEFHQLQGDFDGSAVTDNDDLALWSANFGSVGPPGKLSVDGNADGVTDGLDFLIWQRNFAVNLGPAAAAAAAMTSELSAPGDVGADEQVTAETQPFAATSQNLVAEPREDAHGASPSLVSGVYVLKLESPDFGVQHTLHQEGAGVADSDDSGGGTDLLRWQRKPGASDASQSDGGNRKWDGSNIEKIGKFRRLGAATDACPRNDASQARLRVALGEAAGLRRRLLL